MHATRSIRLGRALGSTGWQFNLRRRYQSFSVAAHEVSKKLDLVLTSPRATDLLAYFFAADLRAGDCFLLFGSVGAGKSHFW